MVRSTGRKDGNHDEIVNGLWKQHGIGFHSTVEIGGGFPDGIIPHVHTIKCPCGRSYPIPFNRLVEIKDGSLPPSKKRLTDDEVRFHLRWLAKGGQIDVIESLADALRVTGVG